MTNKEVIKYLEESKCNQKQEYKHQEIHGLALNLVIQALEKQIPLQVGDIHGDYDPQYNCIICGEITKFEHQKYCIQCGQRLGW